MRASSAGSRENDESTPPSDRSRVTCFSTHTAPIATAAIATPTPRVWSDRPTGTPKASRSTAMLARRASAGSAGYEAVHAKRTSAVQPPSRAAVTAASTSPRVAIPVDMMIGLPVRATSRISGRSTISADAVL
jgi:hypothetical protein